MVVQPLVLVDVFPNAGVQDQVVEPTASVNCVRVQCELGSGSGSLRKAALLCSCCPVGGGGEEGRVCGPLCHFGVERGREHLGGIEHGVGRPGLGGWEVGYGVKAGSGWGWESIPLLRNSEVQHVLPCFERGNDLERLGWYGVG